VRALVGGSVAAAGWIGLTVAFGDFTIIGSLVFGLSMACFFAALPTLLRFANRNAKPS
jgi:hypothetical protein